MNILYVLYNFKKYIYIYILFTNYMHMRIVKFCTRARRKKNPRCNTYLKQQESLVSSLEIRRGGGKTREDVRFTRVYRAPGWHGFRPEETSAGSVLLTGRRRFLFRRRRRRAPNKSAINQRGLLSFFVARWYRKFASRPNHCQTKLNKIRSGGGFHRLAGDFRLRVASSSR